MIFVTTTGKASMDTYAQRLSEHLPGPKIRTDIYDKQDFGVPLVSWKAVKAAWYNFHFTRQLRRLRQPLHLPNHHFGRYGCFLSAPYIIIVADIMRYLDLKGLSHLIHEPNILDKLYLQKDYQGIRRATAVVAISQRTKDDLVQYLGIPAEHIFVTHPGIDHRHFKHTLKRLVEAPYLLFVGSEYPYKNLDNLVRAFYLLKLRGAFEDLKLVKVGASGGRDGPCRKRLLALIQELGLGKDVILTDWVPYADLPAYYSGARCLVFPSLYEGFGFPPLEAMACGCPAVVSSGGALPETVGNAAAVVNPHDIHSIADAIEHILTDDSWRQALIERGLRRSREFTWERTARATLEVHRRVEQII